MSIRLRLTLLYSTILALVLVGFSVALYFTASRVTLDAVNKTLAEEAKRVAASKDFRLDHIGYYTRRFTDPQTYIQTLDDDGQVADRTGNLGDYVLPLSGTGWQQCKNGEPWTEIVITENGRLLVYSQPIWEKEETGETYAGVLQVARSLVEHDQSLKTLQNILASGSL